MIRSLQIFRDLTVTQSFTETANRNYITQSAVSHHLKALEDKLGHTLIERNRKSLQLTKAGEITLEAASDLIERYGKLEVDLKQMGKELAGTIRIATILSVGLHELPSHVNAFLKYHPKVGIKFSYLKPAEIYQEVLTGKADLGFVAFPAPHPRLKITLFKQDAFSLIVHPGHHLAQRKHINLNKIAGESFVTLPEELPIRKSIDKILRQAGVKVRIAHVFDNFESVKQAVESGLGVSMVPRGIIQKEIQAKTLKELEINEGPFQYPIGILMRKNEKPSPCVQAFI
ncbi:MAG: LysR family transcriptional regulator [Candidatus Omnitrophica bacterium]|nr:LysR family transcriptional regulator [Candidatus Omnitrophota bacterium]